MSERRRSVYLLYQLLLGLGSLLLLPWALLRLLTQPDFRRSLPRRLGFVTALPSGRKRTLLHGVSVGEVKALRPLVECLRRQRPEQELVISASTPSGLETARRAFPELTVVQFPLDFSVATLRFLDRVKLDSVILAELEIWPNFLRHCTRRKIPVAIVNGRITERSMGGYKKVQKLLPQFDRIQLYCVQNQRYAERFLCLDVPPDSVKVTGNLKYDSLPKGGGDPAPLWQNWLQGRPTVVLASTHEPEEEWIMLEVAKHRELDSVLFLVVPRHPKRAVKVAQTLARLLPDRLVIRRSQTDPNQTLAAGSVMVVDSFGELEDIYAATQLAVVGGSLTPHGGQNVLEAAAFGLPVVVGPHVENFTEEIQLLEGAGGLERAESALVLVECLRNWLADPTWAHAIGLQGQAALDSRRGAAEKTFAALTTAGLF
jgi:3-deoxy-D-manno-octulosonic-acid transferase